MEIYKLVTELDRFEWEDDCWEDVRIVWNVDPVTRQFAVSLDDIRNWRVLTVRFDLS